MEAAAGGVAASPSAGRVRLPVVDVVTGVALAGFAAGITPVSRVTQPDVRPLSWVGYLLLVVAGMAVAGRRPWPVWSYVLAVAASTAYLAARFPGWPVYILAVAGLVALAGAFPDRRWVLPAACGGVAVAVATGPPERWQPGRMTAVAVGWAVVAVAAGQAALARQRRVERDTRARLVEERLRIARELHDVLSHSLASISMQAGVGLHLLDERPSQAGTALRAIRDISNEALAQARSALSAIRDPDHPGAAPSVADLDQLAASVRAAGTPVEMSIDLEADGLPGEVNAAVYRIVQEALTNVMRHAGESATAAVRVHSRQGQVIVEVHDDGRGSDEPGRPGHGLGGIRERVQALDGQLDAGRSDAGGWKVRAVLPTRRGSL